MINLYWLLREDRIGSAAASSPISGQAAFAKDRLTKVPASIRATWPTHQV